MIPSIFVLLREFPYTSSGKLDRGALPTPDQARTDLEESFVPPNTTVEKKLAEIWCQVLSLSKVGIRDNFFDLGGHSLLATQVISRMRDVLSVELALSRFFESPTIELLAKAVEKEMARGLSASNIAPVSRKSYRANDRYEK
jgi:hypothetical protein